MKRLLILLLFLPFLISAATEITGKVVKVSDGDTIKVYTGSGKPVTIRLHGIDCPEKKQAFGSVATKFTSDFCFGKEARVVVFEKDRYGRSIGEVFVGDKSLNKALVKNGFAWWYRYFANNDKELERLESEARKAKIGLWKDKNPVPPWEFRKRKK